MYNLLVTAQVGAWDRGFYEYDRSRFLEYTRDDIVADLKSLDGDSIKKLKEYPCLFAYEGTDEKLQVGRIISIKPKKQNRSVVIEYEMSEDFAPFSHKAIDEIASALLDISAWEMNRTHWAVKDEDLLDRLESHGVFENSSKSTKLGARGSKTKTLRGRGVRSVEEFVAAVLEKARDESEEVFFRGHSNAGKFRLEPSLFRIGEGGKHLYLDNENILYRELIVSNSADFEGDIFTLDRLVRMQHHSLPTRLLDITSNPLMALYFACKDTGGKKSVGEVVSLSIKRDQIKYYDSDVVSCIANLARLSYDDKEDISFEEKDPERFSAQPSIQRLVHQIREEKSYFAPKIRPDDLRSIVCVKGKRSNDRISSQSGAFLLFGLGAVLDEEGDDNVSISRIRVPIANKASILEELDQLNINDSSVFPYIENSAKYVAEKFRLK